MENEHTLKHVPALTNKPELNEPWMVAVWPGMGQVALSAGYYLISKLNMTTVAEFSSEDLFDVDHVNVDDGLIVSPARPRSRLFIWRDPKGFHDIMVLIGEAQPPRGKYELCRDLVALADNFGVRRIFTFASMATRMHPEHDSRIFGAATDGEALRELELLEVQALTEGRIGGLNGVLLGTAAEAGIRGTCLLGEIPHVFSHVPFPKASLRVLEIFAAMSGIDLDFEDLAAQAKFIDQKLGEVLSKIEKALNSKNEPPVEEDVITPETINGAGLNEEQKQRIESLFEAAGKDRSRAYELKQVLDELEAYQEFEDRFLDLFSDPNPEK